MLNMYQLWLDDLYPRAKFADALAIIEKVGHTKRMQMMRKDWIDEGKPRRNTGQDEDDDDAVQEQTLPQQSTEDMDGVENGGQVDSNHQTEREGSTHNPAEDATGLTASGDPDDDELDALLAESEQPSHTAPTTLPTRPMPTQDDPFADDLEAMADMDDMWD
jgi:replication fork protection complex subunit Csm3/Swi3